MTLMKSPWWLVIARFNQEDFPWPTKQYSTLEKDAEAQVEILREALRLRALKKTNEKTHNITSLRCRVVDQPEREA